MYCINCGIELSKGQRICPICSTQVYHPDFLAEDAVNTYPKKEFQSEEFNRRGIMFVLSVIFALAAVLAVIFDINLSGSVVWSGYVSGGLVLFYLVILLPLWFKKPNPVIFVPCDFVGICLYLLYINFHTNGDWFLSFAFPITAFLGLSVSALTALLHYVSGGRLYILGGFLISLGIWSSLIEFFIYITFPELDIIMWSLYPLITFVVLGLMLIVIAVVTPLRESLRKIFTL